MCKEQTIDVRLCKANESGRKIVPVDACIAVEVQHLNMSGIVTLSCCCGHGRAGQIAEWENGFGRWKGYVDPPHVLITEGSKKRAEAIGYRPFPYIYADGEQHGVWKMYLQTGCLTELDCADWDKREELRTPL
ncbi:hypothetical protein QP794_02655 [Paenibacillus sp. UMB7766-LJ446]|uniref:hypothetical protein n=1 Tax=Paenibacillus sp. UMB7766-LJ446 TaxID=3046313 RepID=UPI00254A22F7|nr:hypothetical protein [Paenibacillus sp. UMB7766-LJ446]MDK8188986.1 hypothetical protein [Paenibacillus sp. UMB7766-LJ446]